MNAVLRSREGRDPEWFVECERYLIAAKMAELSLDKCLGYIQDRDTSLVELAAKDLHWAKRWVEVAGSKR